MCKLQPNRIGWVVSRCRSWSLLSMIEALTISLRYFVVFFTLFSIWLNLSGRIGIRCSLIIWSLIWLNVRLVVLVVHWLMLCLLCVLLCRLFHRFLSWLIWYFCMRMIFDLWILFLFVGKFLLFDISRHCVEVQKRLSLCSENSIA